TADRGGRQPVRSRCELADPDGDRARHRRETPRSRRHRRPVRLPDPAPARGVHPPQAGGMTWSRIAATGGYLPERVMTNRELEAFVDTSDDWIRSRSGIASRHIAADDETTSDMALAAAQSALEQGGIDASEVDLIVVA